MLKIVQLADIHIFNETDRHLEYRDIFNKIYKELNKIKPDKIVICGDLFESKLTLSNEAKILAGELLNNLAKISSVKIVLGNHDLNCKNLTRIDSVNTIVKLINNPNIEYFNKSGMYNDGDLVWVVYHHPDFHPDKNIDPWLNNIKDNNKIYIGLFHDPIYGSSTDNGRVFNDKKYKNLSYFKNNDYLFLGDIHKRDFFRENKSAAYCGSTIQKDHGEKIDKHGFLLWKIETPTLFEVEEYDIPNDHAFVDFYIDEFTDYDNLDLNSKMYKYMDVKVHWKDYSSNINIKNEKKIREYIKNKFNTNKIKLDRTYIYNDIISSKMLSESLDLNDTQVLKNIFKEYLEEQKYKNDDIDDILKIDDIINDRLNIIDKLNNIEWSIEKFWFSNFKSYGDNNEIDWDDVDGIIQISGINKQGKTTILDAITYILYGKTLNTLTPEKFGDNRFINNKRNLDYCLGGAVINANGEKFIIQRKTERIWNKNKTSITSCPTTLDFYISEDVSENNKLTGEIKKKTQDKLNLIIGEFSDFVRLSHVNSDNLNFILSENRSVFIDNIIRDAGYDIFETKLNEFKEYKKELNDEKLVINIEESENDVKILESEIENKKNNIIINNEQISNLEKELNNYNKERDKLNMRLHNIDSNMLNFDENINIESINNYNNKINESNIQITIYNREIDNLPTEFDPKNLNELKLKLKNINDKIFERKDEISKIKNSILESDSKKTKILEKISDLKSNEINKLQFKINENNLNIEKIKNQKDNIINDEINKINYEIKELNLTKTEISNNNKILQKDGLNLKNLNAEISKEIDELKNSTSCPTCGREYDKNDPEYSEHLLHIEDKINSLNDKMLDNDKKINEFIEEYKKLKVKLSDINNDELLLNDKILNLKQGIYNDEIKNKLKEVGSVKELKQKNEDIKLIISEIQNDNFKNSKELYDNILKGQDLIKNIEKTKEDNYKIILNLESELRNFNVQGIENDIEIEEKKKENFDLRKNKISQKENLSLVIENFNLKIKELRSENDKYNDLKLKIEENKNIQISINNIDKFISDNIENIKNITNNNNELDKNIIVKMTEINNISDKMKKYFQQKKKEELLKEYQKCISRDGIPSYLLRKSIHIINKELNDLLFNVDFTLFFDENLNLKMSMNDRLDVSQNAIESCGMERTFMSLVLKMALRSINVKSKSKFICLDEIMGKLISNSVNEFTDLLELLKSKINKIIIIEHVHPIDYQGLIQVSKDSDYISSLEFQK